MMPSNDAYGLVIFGQIKYKCIQWIYGFFHSWYCCCSRCCSWLIFRYGTNNWIGDPKNVSVRMCVCVRWQKAEMSRTSKQFANTFHFNTWRRRRRREKNSYTLLLSEFSHRIFLWLVRIFVIINTCETH